jgi:hypothetical protein
MEYSKAYLVPFHIVKKVTNIENSIWRNEGPEEYI